MTNHIALPVALVPLRMLPTSKHRLAHAVRSTDRQTIVKRLFRHVVSVLRDVGLRVVALSPHEIEDPNGAEVWRDGRSGLNAAVHDAIGKINGPVIVVHADLPWVTCADIERLLEIPADVGIARASDGGTNALLLRRPIRPGFGPGSAITHARRARRAGLRVQVLDVRGLARDVDDVAALTAWRGDASPQPLP